MEICYCGILFTSTSPHWLLCKWLNPLTTKSVEALIYCFLTAITYEPIIYQNTHYRTRNSITELQLISLVINITILLTVSIVSEQSGFQAFHQVRMRIYSNLRHTKVAMRQYNLSPYF